ncbi:hypothetical protein [Aquicoccus sp. SU-CL01552]|uniref:hypothetical protein n=1 Tax=Aquicoccus sp. SU-CL01552 TaxID=3127656 RepID=UPI0031089789
MDLSVLNAALILSNQETFPLRDEEITVRRRLVAADRDAAEEPLGRYTCRLNARMTQRMTQVRRFRRSDTTSVLFKLVGDDFQNASWYFNLAPGTRNSALRPVGDSIFDQEPVLGCHLFDGITERAWMDLSHGQDLAPQDVGRLMRIDIPDHGDDPVPRMTYTDFTGFTRGSFEDLFYLLGKLRKVSNLTALFEKMVRLKACG